MVQKKKHKLPREFWSVNASNLFERGAYYGMTAIAAYHFNTNVGIPSWIIGIFLTISMVMINFLPLFSTALASKYGFKKILLASYFTLFLGYIFLGLGYTIVLVGLAYVVMGFGSGFEKALIAASISHSSDEENRVFAFNVYYWVINTGAFAIPLSLTFLFTPADYGGVFFLMSLFVACSFLIILLSYKNPVQPDPSVPALKAVKGLKIIFKDPKFAIVLIIFSGCWFMLYTRMALIPMYVPRFDILSAEWIPVIAALNPLAIILISPIWSGIIKDRKVDSLKLLIAGIIFASLGFLIVGFSLNPILLISGIVVLSFGELVSYPAFLTYVSKIPPKEKRSIYMGYSFLPLAIAGATGPMIGGFLYYYFAEGLNMGALVW
ncbi:MAG: MFS transporter, partial [Candidatus Thermoplasmatota archaeon]|nr:MFS transporter [Candidatus Thermoplasmatota archaeon]